MAYFTPKTSKAEEADKTPYTLYYPHSLNLDHRKWDQPYYQLVSIDPATKNYAIRIERRYHNGWIVPIAFEKISAVTKTNVGNNTVCNTYQDITKLLSKYNQYYDECHFIIIERQLPQNYKATRIAQHSISYFSLYLANKPLLPSIVEVDPKLKGKVLGAPKGISDKELKSWAVEKARELLTIRKDDFSLQVLNYFKNKQDDLSDTVCQIEALFTIWNLPLTNPPPEIITTKETLNLNIKNPVKVPKLLIDPVKPNNGLSLNIINQNNNK